ncbi:MAG: DUF2934 domain-containing protein [Limisphaerales bacterium]
MKHDKYPPDTNQKTAIDTPSKTVVDMDERNFVPSPDEVARRAYFSYVNQGSSSGHEVQHWLAAEAELIAERDRTRTHGFHNKT